MAFTNKPFVWKNNGVTPPETLQNSGFIGGKKLPAPYVNAQWTATYKAIEELQRKAGEVKTINNTLPNTTGNISVTKSTVGLSNVDNTSDVNKPISNATKLELDKKYAKPTTGIPKTDLESSVQTSLTKAESALQSVPLATAALDGLMAKGDKANLDNVMSVFANLQKMKITNDDGSAVYTIGATLPTVKKGIFHATASTGTYAPPASSVEGIIIAESASYWNFIGASDNGTWCVGTFQGSWKGWTTLATAKDVSNLSTRITALETSDTTHQADLAHVHWIGTAVGTNTLTATYEAITALKNGLGVAFLNATSSIGATTLNINGLGAIPILKVNGNPVTNLKTNGIYTLRYANGNFILQGEGGEYGNATASDVLTGKTIGTEDGIIIGSIPNKVGSNTQFLPSGADQVVPKGYYSGQANDGNVKALTLTPGDGLIAISYTETKYSEGATTTNKKLKEIQITNISGKVQVSFEMASYNHGYTTTGRVYVNGVGVGLVRTVTSPAFVLFTEYVDVKAGDFIQFYGFVDDTDFNTVRVRNFKISAAVPIVVAKVVL